MKQYFPSGGFVRSVMVLAGGAGFAQLITVAVAPLVTRLYSPTDLGLLAVFSGLLGVLSVVSSLRYELAVPLPSETGVAANVLALAVVVTVIFAVVASAVLYFWGKQAMSLVGTPELLSFIWLLPVGLILSGVYRVLSMWAVRTRSYRALAVTRMGQSVSSSLVQVALGLLNLGVFGLLLGQVASQSTGITRLFIVLRRTAGKAVKAIRPAAMWQVAVRYRDLPGLSTVSALLNRVGTYLPSMMLVTYFGPSVGGLYFLTQRVIGLPSAVIGQAVQKTYFGEFAQIARDEPGKSLQLFWSVVRAQAIMGIPVMLLIALPAPWLFTLIFGQKWADAGVYLQTLAPMFLLRFVSTPVGITLTVLERQDLFLYREIIRLLLIVGTLLVAGYAQVPPLEAIVLLSSAGSAGYLLHIFVSWWSLRQHAREVLA